jgi:hypothetical protein
LEKLRTFVEIEISYREDLNGETKFTTQPLRYCTSEDYISKGYKFVSEKDKEEKTLRLCPDMEKMRDFFKIKNGYSNANDRASFSLAIYKCNSTSCQSTKKI